VKNPLAFWRGSDGRATGAAVAAIEPFPQTEVVTQSSPAKRYFFAAHQHKYSGFQVTLEVAHKALQKDLVALRAHSRQLCQNNPYAKRYVNLVSTHVVGPDGITLESAIIGNANRPKTAWNDTIEAEWEKWGEAVTTDGLSTWTDFQHLVAQTTAMDGECLIHTVRGYPNAWGFALELIDADRLDWTWNAPVDSQGNRTIMGIQMDRWGRRTGYWIWSEHPMDYEGAPRRVFVPASEIVHVFAEDRAKSIRGIPWSTSVMVQLNMLGTLWNSELKAANYFAENIVLIKGPAAPADEDGKPIQHLDEEGKVLPPLIDPVSTANALHNEAGEGGPSFMGLDNGTEAQFPPANHPNPHLPDFAKNLLKSVASGVNVAYHSLASDVADANYTASRVALLDERDNWRKLQRWYIARVCNPVFRAWLEMAVASGAITLPVTDWRKLCAPKWWPRSWDWVDPEKEAKASILGVRSGLSTYQEELGALGRNWRKVFRQRKAEEDYQLELGLHLELDMGKGNANQTSDPGDPTDIVPTETEAITPPVKGAKNESQ